MYDEQEKKVVPAIDEKQMEKKKSNIYVNRSESEQNGSIIHNKEYLNIEIDSLLNAI